MSTNPLRVQQYNVPVPVPLVDNNESTFNSFTMSIPQSGNKALLALFEADSDFAEEFKDKVGAIHKFFDRDQDGFLNKDELADLQYKTSGTVLDSDQYVMVCKALGCQPNKGIPLDALRLTYAADGTNLDDDYYKVFPEKKKPTKNGDADQDKIYEVGADGVDISD